MLNIAEIIARHRASAPFKGKLSAEKQYNIVREDRAFLLKEIERLSEQLRDAETSLSIYDETCSSHYWDRHYGNKKHE